MPFVPLKWPLGTPSPFETTPLGSLSPVQTTSMTERAECGGEITPSSLKRGSAAAKRATQSSRVRSLALAHSCMSISQDLERNRQFIFIASLTDQMNGHAYV